MTQQPGARPSKADLERIAREAYDRCHPDDSFEDLRRRAAFSKEDRCLLRDWLACVAR
jgi:hypothetical protein